LEGVAKLATGVEPLLVLFGLVLLALELPPHAASKTIRLASAMRKRLLNKCRLPPDQSAVM